MRRVDQWILEGRQEAEHRAIVGLGAELLAEWISPTCRTSRTFSSALIAAMKAGVASNSAVSVGAFAPPSPPAFTVPSVRARAMAGRAQRTPPEVIAAMDDIGFAAPREAQMLSPRALEGAALVVRFGDLRLPSDLPGERWDVTLPGGASIEQVRPNRDALRRRVWRLVSAAAGAGDPRAARGHLIGPYVPAASTG